MRIIRLLCAVVAGCWLLTALLKVMASLQRPDSVAEAIGAALIPLFVFLALAFGGRSRAKK